MENDNENFDSKIEEITEDTVNEEEADEVDSDDSDQEDKLSVLEKKVKELEAQKKHWQKKATTPKAEPKAETEGLSQKDLYALIANKVHEDDIDEVVAYAKLKNIDVKEALKSSVVKTILKDNDEVRQTNQVSNTRTSRKAPQERTADQIMQQIQKGEMPESEADMVKAFNKIAGLDK